MRSRLPHLLVAALLRAVGVVREHQYLHRSAPCLMADWDSERVYHVNPSTASILHLAGSAVLEAHRLIEGHQPVVRQDGDAVGNATVLHALDVSLQQRLSKAAALELGLNGQRVDGNGTALLLVTGGRVGWIRLLPPAGRHGHVII